MSWISPTTFPPALTEALGVTLTEELQLVRNKQPKRWTSVQQFSDVANRQVGRVEEEIILPSQTSALRDGEERISAANCRTETLKRLSSKKYPNSAASSPD
jgi:hypothetical protein